MLNKEEIKRLEDLIKAGKKAEKVLDKHNRLLNELNRLKEIQENSDKYYGIELRNGFYSENLLFTGDREKIAELLKQIIQIEIDNIEAELNKIKLEEI